MHGRQSVGGGANLDAVLLLADLALLLLERVLQGDALSLDPLRISLFLLPLSSLFSLHEQPSWRHIDAQSRGPAHDRA